MKEIEAVKLRRDLPELGIEYRGGNHVISDSEARGMAILLQAQSYVAISTSA